MLATITIDPAMVSNDCGVKQAQNDFQSLFLAAAVIELNAASGVAVLTLLLHPTQTTSKAATQLLFHLDCEFISSFGAKFIIEV
jgi:hypothetical protein